MGTSESTVVGAIAGEFLIAAGAAEVVVALDVVDGHAKCTVPNVGMVAPAANA
jgi:hypothetical protein